MGTVVRFTPLCGVSEEAPLCYLLEIDSFTILLDCGWDESFDEALLEPIKSVLPRVDAVLLSHPDLAHLGALPALVGRCGLAAPLYSTKPVRRMGEMTCFEACVAKQAISDFTSYSLDDVDAAFRLNPRWTELRYAQRHTLVPPTAAPPADGAAAAAADGTALAAAAPGGGISITAHPAGRLPGGAVWRISLGCGEEVVYAVDYNHRKERLLNGTAFHELLGSQQPALLVSDARSALAPPLDRRRRDEEMLDAISATVECEGSVLIPTDPAGRVLELALLLDEHFAKARVAATPVLLSATIRTVLEFARSQLEYLGSELAQAFSLKRTVPFSFRKLVLATRMEELGAIPGPKVVLATLPSLEAGPARQLLVEWAAQPRNTIIFTERAHPGTLASALQSHVPGPEPLRLPLRVASRVPLEGEELAAWQAAKAAEAAGEADPLLSPTAGLSAGARLAASNATPGPGPHPSAASGSAASASAPCGLLRASTGTISRLVRDAATGAVVQQLVGATPGGGGAGGGAAAAGVKEEGGGGAGGGGGGAWREGWDAGLLLDGFEPPQDAAHPMFPDEDAELYGAWDEYGAVLGKDEFRVPMFAAPDGLGRAAGPDAMDVDGGGGGSGPGGGGGADVADEVEEAPTKLVEAEVQLEVRAALRFFDYEGRSEGRAVREYLGQAAPRRLVLVGGGEAARAELAGAMRHDLAEYGTEVHTPGPGQAVEAALAPSRVVALGEALAASLDVRQAGQYGVAWLEGVLARGGAADPATGAPVLQLEPLPPAADALPLGHPAYPEEGGGGGGSVLLAQAGAALTLSRLKAALAAAGFESHFPSRGVLAVMAGEGPSGGTLVITLGPPTSAASASAGFPGSSSSSSDRAHVQLEGPTCEAYFRVREVIYQQFGVC